MNSKPEKLEFARRLSRNQTHPEQLLWSKLRDRRLAGHKFVRQAPIGAYVVDFLCRQQFLIIELDGASHDDHGLQDSSRQKVLEGLGFTVVRFSNDDVLRNPDVVLDGILKALGELTG